MYTDFNLTLTRGDDEELEIEVFRKGKPFALTGGTFWFTGKRLLTDPDAAAVISCTSTGGQIAVDPLAAHRALVTVPAAQTDVLTQATRLYCDFQIKVAGKIKTVSRGTVNVILGVTRAS